MPNIERLFKHRLAIYIFAHVLYQIMGLSWLYLKEKDYLTTKSQGTLNTGQFFHVPSWINRKVSTVTNEQFSRVSFKLKDIDYL